MVLAYRHAFHAGGPADVLKHCLLVSFMRNTTAHLGRIGTQLRVVDTHAGAGKYNLKDRMGSKLQEYNEGVVKLLKSTSKLPTDVRAYIKSINRLNSHKNPSQVLYPGSPLLLADSMKTVSCPKELHLFELHSTDHQILWSLFVKYQMSGRLGIYKQDGFSGVAELLRKVDKGMTCVVIDPSYEIKSDYPKVLEAVRLGLSHNGQPVSYFIWYPFIKGRPDSKEMINALKAEAAATSSPWLDASLSVRHPDSLARGMYGSGVFIINPPSGFTSDVPDILSCLSSELVIDRHFTQSTTFSLSH